MKVRGSFTGWLSFSAQNHTSHTAEKTKEISDHSFCKVFLYLSICIEIRDSVILTAQETEMHVQCSPWAALPEQLASMMCLIHLLCYDSISTKNPLKRENIFLLSNNVRQYTARTIPIMFQAKSLDYLFHRFYWHRHPSGFLCCSG